MQIPSSGGRRGASANMTPMIDVVFLLIIFFLVSSHLARQENRLPLDLPLASTFDVTDPTTAPLTISIDGGGDWLIGGQVVDLETLKTAFRQHRAQRGRDAAIRIRCDGGVPYRFVHPMLREAALAGLTDAAIAVREDRG